MYYAEGTTKSLENVFKVPTCYTWIDNSCSSQLDLTSISLWLDMPQFYGRYLSGYDQQLGNTFNI